MPVMDGLDATRAIRGRESGTSCRTPIIAMTAHATPGDRERCLAAGMDDHVAKPIRWDVLVDKINSQIIGEDSQQPSLPDQASAEVDWPAALSAVNGDGELLRDVVEAFLDEAPQLLAQIDQAIEDEDAAELRRAAHTLKGSMRFFGCHLACEHAFRLETMGKEQELRDAASRLDVLQQEMTRLTPKLLDYVGRSEV